MQDNLKDKLLKNRVNICFIIAIIAFFTIIYSLSTYLLFAKYEKVDIVINNPAYTNNISSPVLPNELYFAGEEVPVTIWWVRENLDREIINVVYNHSRTLLIYKKIPRYFPIIEQILRQNNIPDDMKYLCVAESSLENVVSPAKAAGFWQFLDKTAKLYQLIVNDEVDERYNIEKSTLAACKYLANGKSNLGSWTLAAAAYNMGEAGLNKSIDNNNNNDNYWEMVLNQETARYIYRILAYKIVFENPELYGITVKNSERYYPVPTNEVEISEKISNLPEFAKNNNITYLELKKLNPWLRSYKLTMEPINYKIKIPAKCKYKYYDLYE